MPSTLRVPPLLHLATQVVLSEVLDCISLHSDSDTWDVNSDILLQIKDTYLSNISADLREEMLYYMLSSDTLNVFQRFASLQLFLDTSVKRLVSCVFPETYHSRVLSLIATQGTGLTTLDIRGLWIKQGEEINLSGVLQCLTQLTVLRIPHMATYQVLHTLSRCNPCLRVLDISGESQLTNEGVEALCVGNNKALELVSIGRPGDCVCLEPDTIALLIRHLPNLSSLGCYSYVGKALSCLPEDITKVTNLRYVHDTCTDVSVMRVIVERCPKLKSIYLDRPDEEVVPRIGLLAALKDVKLSRFNCDEFNLFLVKCGARILTLNLVIGHGIMDVSKIAEYCTELRSLKFYKMEQLVYFQEIEFCCLKKLDIFYSSLSTTCLRYFIASSPHLEKLCLNANNMSLSNLVISEIFADKTYGKIKTILISDANLLSVAALGTILTKCPNLNTLGYLGTWDLLPDEIEEFQICMKALNFDLNLEV